MKKRWLLLDANGIPIFTWRECARFWSKVDVRRPDECWNWQGGVTPQGYGQFSFNGAMCSAHRVAKAIQRERYDLLIKQRLTNKKSICHRCDNRVCCNPKHLYIGTRKHNANDREVRKRGNHPKGEQNSSSKLTADLVRKIRAWGAKGYGNTQIAKHVSNKYHIEIDHTNVYRILHRKNWRHI